MTKFLTFGLSKKIPQLNNSNNKINLNNINSILPANLLTLHQQEQIH